MLPSLAFGDSGKQRLSSVHEFGDALRRAGYVVHDLDGGGEGGTLAADVACVNMPSVTVVAVSSSAHRVVTERAGRISLCFGGEGRGVLSTGRSSATYHRSAAALTPLGPVQWRIDECASDVEVSCDCESLASTARSMLGFDAAEPLPALSLEEVRPIALRTGVVDGRATLLHLAVQADRYRGQPRVLSASGIEDQFLRHAVLVLMPEAFQGAVAVPLPRPGEKTAVDRLCEWLRAHLGSPVTLTDMERVSGLSARSLQLSFQKRHAVTPMAWLRELRLLAARDLLIHAAACDAGVTVSAVAEQTGFGSAHVLHRWYRKRFGETPGDTLRRRA